MCLLLARRRDLSSEESEEEEKEERLPRDFGDGDAIVTRLELEVI